MHRYNKATTKYKDVPNEEKFLIALDMYSICFSLSLSPIKSRLVSITKKSTLTPFFVFE